MAKYTIEEYLPVLANSPETKSVLVLPAVNALGEVYMKEVLSTWKQLMHFSVGSPKHNRIVICTQDQILKKFLDDRKTDTELVEPCKQLSVAPSPDTIEEASLAPAQCDIEVSNESTQLKPQTPLGSIQKRPDLPRYVSPAARKSAKSNVKQRDSDPQKSSEESITSLPTNCRPRAPVSKLCVKLEQPPEDEVWKQLDDTQMEEIYGMLGEVELMKPSEEDCPSRMRLELKDNALDHIVELYNMHKEIKTKEIVTLFDKFHGVQSHIKWVDDERALVVFSSTELAKDALQVFHPVIQTRLVENGSRESKLKILSCASSSNILPWKERPKTVTFMARRLISSQLGPEFQNVSPKVLQKESSIIQEAIAQKQVKVSKRQQAGGT